MLSIQRMVPLEVRIPHATCGGEQPMPAVNDRLRNTPARCGARGIRPADVSVIATVRNEHETITAFVESLLGQTLRPEEIVIVEGASADGTLDILNGYADRHAVRVISQPCNVAQGRNLGIAAATGTYIAATDAGCKVDSDLLQEIVACIRSRPKADVVAGNFRFEAHSDFEEAVVLVTLPPNRDDTDNARFYPSSRSVAFTTAAWKRAGGYPEWLYAAEDTLFNIRLRQVGCHFVFCRSAIVRWRLRENWRALGQAVRQPLRFQPAALHGRAFGPGVEGAGYRMSLGGLRPKRLPVGNAGNHMGACFLYARGGYDGLGDCDPELFLVEDNGTVARFRFDHIAGPPYYFRRDADTLASPQLRWSWGAARASGSWRVDKWQQRFAQGRLRQQLQAPVKAIMNTYRSRSVSFGGARDALRELMANTGTLRCGRT